MNTLKYFLLGVWEFRSAWTTDVSGWHILAYDRGRELAHLVTFRRFEQ